MSIFSMKTVDFKGKMITLITFGKSLSDKIP